jgi:putative DNA primase/helicase
MAAKPQKSRTVKESPKKAATTFDAASAYLTAVISLIPIARDGTKRPSGLDLPVRTDESGEAVFGSNGRPERTWDPYKDRLPTRDEVFKWYDRPNPPGVAVISGKVSGNLELMDFDQEAETVYPQWCELVEAECPGLVARLSVVRTPRPGYHARYRCPDVEIPGNTKVAEAIAVEPTNGKPTTVTLIETRGEGGYSLAPGCPAECHETGGTYEHFSGPKLSQVEDITAAEREVLWRCARSFNQVSPRASAGTGKGGHAGNGRVMPGDDFDLNGPDWPEILEGWEVVRQSGDVRYWRRPGKEAVGWSATTGYCKGQRGEELLKVFSSNAAPFEMEGSYGKFRAYALLRHLGNFTAAAR